MNTRQVWGKLVQLVALIAEIWLVVALLATISTTGQPVAKAADDSYVFIRS